MISGPEMLRAARSDAVRNWRYKPYLLNGEPTEVETTITVNFNFGGRLDPGVLRRSSITFLGVSLQACELLGDSRVKISGRLEFYQEEIFQ